MRIAVIGAGIVGSLIARELTRYEADILLIEKEPDVGWGVTKANSAIVHGGFHETPGTQRARFCVEGNKLYETLCSELDVPFKRIGAHVIALSDDDIPTLRQLYEQGVRNGVPGIQLHDRETTLASEPNLNPDVMLGLWSPSVGIIEPWNVAMAAVENATHNGLDLHLDEEVTSIATDGRRIVRVSTNEAEYDVDAVVNAAGLFSDHVAAMVGISEPVIFPRRGEYALLDKRVGTLVSSVVFPTPNADSKGILVVPTVDGGVLLGPTAEDLARSEKEATNTTREGVRKAIEGARRLVPNLDPSLVVKTFSGLRPETQDNQFVVGSTPISGFFQAAGMHSPGLTAAPAVARHLVHEVMAQHLGLEKRRGFDPIRHRSKHVVDLPVNDADKLIDADPRYGHVICQCNHVTEGEIVDAIRRGARTLDGVKFRTHAGFGRCQGGFCTDRILMILARELDLSPSDVSLCGGESRILGGAVRQ